MGQLAGRRECVCFEEIEFPEQQRAWSPALAWVLSPRFLKDMLSMEFPFQRAAHLLGIHLLGAFWGHSLTKMQYMVGEQVVTNQQR